MKKQKVKLGLFPLIIALSFFNCSKKEEEYNYIYNSDYSSTQILSKEELLDSSLVNNMFDKLDDIQFRTQKEFTKKDTNKRIIYFYYSDDTNVNIRFITKDDDLSYSVGSKEVKLNKIQIEYLQDFLKNLKQLKLHREDLIFSFNLSLPENQYNENAIRQPPPPPPF